MNFIYKIEDDPEETIMNLNYFMDGYMKREEFFRYNSTKRKEMR